MDHLCPELETGKPGAEIGGISVIPAKAGIPNSRDDNVIFEKAGIREKDGITK
jgi:hypothetical protein